MKNNEAGRYACALAYAAKMHAGQLRKGGAPYITHPEAVAAMLREAGYSLDHQICGLFHDLLEDTCAGETEILALGGPEVLCAVKLLTKPKNYQMSIYMAGICQNPMAYAVKEADRRHNLQSALCTDAAFKRQYLEETAQWYWDFSPEIRAAARALAKTLEPPVPQLPPCPQPTTRGVG